MAEGEETIAGAGPGARMSRLPRAWLVAGLALWIEIGILLVDRANRQGLVGDVTLSPYHLVGYVALATLTLYVVRTLLRGLRHGRWRTAFPPLYGGVALAFVCFLGWVVLDIVWRNTFGINADSIETGLAPPRLLLPLGLVFLAAGPLQEALERSRSGARPSLVAVGPALIAVTVIGSALTLVAFNPVREPRNDVALAGARDISEIWTMAADGSGQTRLVAAKGDGIDYSLPAWSPDGARLAYTRWKNASGVATNTANAAQTSGIWTVRADGSDPRQVVETETDTAWIPAWSPDGQWIAYTFNSGVAPAAPAEPQPNVAPGQIEAPLAAPGAEIWIVHPDGSSAHRISAEDTTALAAVWSPDGDQIAYISGPGAGDIHVATVTDAGLVEDRVIAAHAANDWAPAWSPDGSRLAFVSDRAGNDDVWTVGLDGANLAQVTRGGEGDWVPAWSADGSRLAFVSDRGGDVEVWSMAADGSGATDLSSSPQRDDGRWSVAWSPDGSRIAYASAAYPEPAASGWVLEDFAATNSLLFGLSLAVVALLLVGLGAPLGSSTIVLTGIVLLAAAPTDEWRFIPAAVLAGALVDGLLLTVRRDRRAYFAGAALPAAAILGIGLTLLVGNVQAWSPTLLLGITLAVGLLGLGLAVVTRRLAPVT